TDQSIEQIKASIQVQPIIAKVLDDLALIYLEATAKIQVDWHSLGDLALPQFVSYSVLKNLLENALLHANADMINVSIQKNTLHIQDNDPHLNPQDIRYLGQRFWRKSSQQKGHGLGLS